MIRLTAICAALSAAILFDAAAAQDFDDYQRRQADLVALSSIFGELHHIRRNCEPRLEADIWRERMKKMIALEEPQPAAQQEMVAAFNKGYRAAGQHFPGCSRRARDHAAARAVDGERIIARLTNPLRRSLAQDQIQPQ